MSSPAATCKTSFDPTLLGFTSDHSPSAFTQLEADNQHAPLGLMLLAVLAHISTLVSNLSSSDTLSTSEPTPIPIPIKSIIVSPAGVSGPDMGVAVSRNNITPTTATPPTNRITPTSRSRTSKSDDGLLHDVEKLDRDLSMDAHKVVKRKKKKRGGDELSSLFGSL